MTQDILVLALKITEAVRSHLKETDCNHSIKEIMNEALASRPVPTPSGGVVDNGDSNCQLQK